MVKRLSVSGTSPADPLSFLRSQTLASCALELLSLFKNWIENVML
jgi:hypothetical protein